MRAEAFLFVLTALAFRAEAQEGASREVFDGGSSHAASAKAVIDVCGRDALEHAQGDRGVLSAEEAVCRPAAAAGTTAARLIALEGLDAVGHSPARRRAARMAQSARKSPAFGEKLRMFYARVADAEASAVRSDPGWVWRLALKSAEGDPLQAHRLIAYCGSDELEREPLRSRLTAAQARAAFERDARGLQPKDFLTVEEDVCRATGAAFFAPGGLAAGLPAADTPAASAGGLLGSSTARAYAASRAACELAAAGMPREEAVRAAANAAWAGRRLAVAGEVRRARHMRAALAQRYQDARRRAPAAAEPEEAFLDRELRRGRESARRPLDWLDRERMDALLLLEKSAGVRETQDWSAARRSAAQKALDALARAGRAAAAAEESGARFGAAACAAR